MTSPENWGRESRKAIRLNSLDWVLNLASVPVKMSIKAPMFAALTGGSAATKNKKPF
jgi:hypothetical protein